MPTLDTVDQSVSQINAQHMANSHMSQPVVSFSSGGTTFYHQNTFSKATVVNQPNKPLTAPLQPLWRCPKFTSQNPTQRTTIVAENRLCFSYLKRSHQFRNCPQPQ